MKRFLTFLCLLASLVVLAPQTILAEESSSGQTTTKLDLSQKVGSDSLGYVMIPSDFVKFNELGEQTITNIKNAISLTPKEELLERV